MERPGDRYVFLQYIKRSNSNNNNDVDEKKKTNKQMADKLHTTLTQGWLFILFTRLSTQIFINKLI